MSRVVAWFSCGAASAVATMLILKERQDAVVARCVVENEHADNDRFAYDCADWFGKPVLELRSAKYKDCWQVWKERRYLNGPGGALCTVEMKKKVRQDFQRPDDLHIFGFTSEEKKRAQRFIENNPELNVRFPLIERGMSKHECLSIISTIVKIELPKPYLMGYHNANCVGCVKGGKGYWNKIRVDEPEIFWRMAALEREIGHSCITGVFLDELPPGAGRHEDLKLPDCGIACEGGE